MATLQAILLGSLVMLVWTMISAAIIAYVQIFGVPSWRRRKYYPVQEYVELRPAFAFTCDACGRESYASGEFVEELEDVRFMTAYGEEMVTGAELLEPEFVECHHCGVVFRAELFNDLSVDEEYDFGADDDAEAA